MKSMKRVACLAAVVAAGLMYGCEKPPEKLEVGEIHSEMSGAPNVKVDSAAGVALAPLPVELLRDEKAMKKDYDARTTALANAASSGSGGSGDSGTTPVAETKPMDPGEAGLIGVWKAVKLDPEPATPEQAAELMKKGVEFQVKGAEHTFHVLEGGKPAGEEGGTWKIVEGNVELTPLQAFEFKIAGKQLKMQAGGTTVIMEK